ncbi:PREDICTED: G-type lectin S-receptor-like serine/threonine-protein kinase At4g03230 [Populus euphratica]|uniref:non-specific serine/threonine protein kinase n=1 Tax=Populus euphratica TaxID=75702 RepID=A0AAJ6TXA4_POPEU|nr:PREDICTED: G-type lectin S-receptor-like serine/threonine-protein kinase At4g03230 [Populus euphratica]
MDDLKDLQEEYSYGGPDLFVRVTNADTVVDGQAGGYSRKKKPLSLIVGVTIASVIVLSSIFLYICILMRKKAKRRESQQITERNAALLYGTEKRVKNLIEAEEFKEEDKKGIDVPFFDLDSILGATDYFSEANKLGRGGFGPVYKGKFPGGQEIAIKRLSSVSGQGLEEFKNEVILIARLQHRNLVRLVGYCIKGDDKILLYEYMPNKSLDSFIFDRDLGMLLNWEMRFDIILGVARGLLYLHQDSRLRIIHRDMKTSNILLDAEMNPKISYFGLARMFEGKQTEGSTNRVAGTYLQSYNHVLVNAELVMHSWLMVRRGLNQRDLRAMHSMLSTVFFSYAFLLCSFLVCCFARDTITYAGNLTSHDGGETLVSAGKRFELGFFTPEQNERYVGIWYYRSNPRIVVWVANRNSPLLDDGAVLAVTDDGNLKILDKNGDPFWSTELQSTSKPGYRLAKLLDSGNLVFGDSNTLLTTILWQSFEHPTDTFLSGMKMSGKLKLISWKSQVDPKEGNFTFKLDEETDQFVISDGSIKRWTSGESSDFFRPERMPGVIEYFLSNFTRGFESISVSNPTSILNGINLSLSNFSDTRIRLDVKGELQYLSYNTNGSKLWWEPKDKCSVYNACGNFGSCNLYNKLACRCLPGFEPKSLENWKNDNFSSGCSRSSDPCVKKNTFLSFKTMKFGQPEKKFEVDDEKQCREECSSNCLCQAYSFVKVNVNMRRDRQPSTCLIWMDDDIIKDLQEEYSYAGPDLFVRVATSDIESKARSCEPCGMNVIPYPLSTGSDCGDPMYFRFHCDNSIGKLSFKTPSGTYNVTTINQYTRTFLIRDKDVDDCNDGTRGQIQNFNTSSPFKLNASKRWCASNVSSQGLVEIDIGWEPPPEPVCSSSSDCDDWPYSTCDGTGNGTARCLCNSNFWWDGIALRCVQGGSSRKEKPLSLIVGVAIAIVIVLSSIFLYICILMRKKAKRRESQQITERNAALLYGTEKRVENLMDAEEFKEEDKKGIDVPFFDLDSILGATDYFSEANKLGRGGFGPVYKGKFPGGQEIAIKRLSSVSGQGLEEFKNEVILIARLQHRNLVRLVGYCIKGDEKILLYEYMPNKSLDSFIFDRDLGMLLNWEMRFDIILGVARGLLYLHQDSRLRIIHRDMKTSNILLDAEMNPKISDFGLARMFEGKQTEGSTNRVVGTYGYMSPEYALDGLFSVKSDVFSFGIVVLEILSGKRNTGYFNSDEAQSLLAYAWRLWREDKALDLMDETLREICNTNEFLRCVNAALLCVQDDPSDRPTMSNVVVMLSSETANLPVPKKPAFFIRRGLSGTASSSSKQGTGLFGTASSSSKQETSFDTTIASDEGR